MMAFLCNKYVFHYHLFFIPVWGKKKKKKSLVTYPKSDSQFIAEIK